MKKLLIFVDTDDYLIIENIRRAFAERDYTFLANRGIEIYQLNEDNSMEKIK